MIRGVRKLTAVLLACVSWNMSGQSTEFSHYTEKEGLTYPFVYSINQDSKGNILVGTGEGLFTFDSKKFKFTGVKQGLANEFIETSFTDSRGRIWFGHKNGSVTLVDPKGVQPIDLSLIAKSRVNRIFEDTSGKVWILTQSDGLILLEDGKEPKAYYKDFLDKICHDATALQGGGILLADDSGLYLLREKSQTDDTFDIQEVNTDGRIVTKLSVFQTEIALAATNENELLEIKNISGKISISGIKPTGYKPTSIANISKGNHGDFWLATRGNGAIRVRKSSGEYKARSLIRGSALSENIQVVFLDREGVLWVGTYGQGLVKVSNSGSNHFALFRENQSIAINAIEKIENTLWVGTDYGIGIIDRDRTDTIRFLDKKMRLPEIKITTLILTDNGKVWAGTEKEGIFKADLKDTIFSQVQLPDERLGNYIRQLCQCGEFVYAATASGLYEYDFGGKILNVYTLTDGLLHNSVQALNCEANRNLRIATESTGLNLLDTKTKSISKINLVNARVNSNHINKLNNGVIGFATEGAGAVFISANDTVILDSEDGLMSNYCMSILPLGTNAAAIAHQDGISFADIESERLKVMSVKDGFGYSFMKRSAIVDELGILWFGTATGIFRHEPKDHFFNLVEPVPQIVSIRIGDREVSDAEVSELPYGIYSLRIEYFAASHLNPEDVTYSYILEGYADTWSERSKSNISLFTGLQPGEYTLKIRAYNADGFGGTTEATLKISIEKPFWQKIWFITAAILMLLGLFYAILKRRTRMLIKYQKQLETELKQKTSEILSQKEMLEVQNKDITDSIRYAKNIQKALLPQKGKLKQWFPESFVFFKPRDIVSGDFYWVEQFGDRLIIACADCTGHGVPGAILSVLGSGILREISRNPLVDRTSVALTALDRELRQLLQNTGSDSGVDDGMDIILLDVHLNTGEMYFSSARRPLVILRQGEALVFKGDKTPVGGGLYESDRVFEEKFVQLQQDDCIYLFSDGITDQFGGPKGKKLKTKGFIDFLQSIESHDMNAQYVLLRSFYINWKGIHAQVDDILVVGFKW